MAANFELWSRGRVDAAAYDVPVNATRSHYARLVGVDVGRVAIGSQTSSLVASVAAALPPGAEVLVPDEEFTSVVFPFLAAGLSVRSAPLDRLSEAVTRQTDLVAFSVVQSATGEVADCTAIAQAASTHEALTLMMVGPRSGV
jgi:selenocysteine lyase/cysteine desulfurase